MKQHCNVYDAIIVGGGHNGLVAASYLAKAGKTVLLLEAHDELGGATTSVKPFPEYDARLSRYSYLVSLLPDQIVTDLGINFKTLGRAVASYTPYHRNGQDDGLLISTDWDEATASSFRRLTASDREGKAWREFYGEIATLAQRFASSAPAFEVCGATQSGTGIAGGVALSHGGSDWRSHTQSLQ